MGSKHVVGLTIIWVVLTENGGEALIKPVNKIVANKNGDANILAERVNCVHYPLVVRKDRGSYKGTVTILVCLMNCSSAAWGLSEELGQTS